MANRGNKRVVFKQSIGSPFNYDWPIHPDPLQVLSAFLSLVKPTTKLRLLEKDMHYLEYQKKRRQRQRDKAHKQGQEDNLVQFERQKGLDAIEVKSQQQKEEWESHVEESKEIMQDFVIGINAVTRYMESKRMPRLRALLVCRGDLDTPQLYQHLPAVAFISGCRFICPLGKGAEVELSKGLMMKRVSVVGIKVIQIPFFIVLYSSPKRPG